MAPRTPVPYLMLALLLILIFSSTTAATNEADQLSSNTTTANASGGGTSLTPMQAPSASSSSPPSPPSSSSSPPLYSPPSSSSPSTPPLGSSSPSPSSSTPSSSPSTPPLGSSSPSTPLLGSSSPSSSSPASSSSSPPASSSSSSSKGGEGADEESSKPIGPMYSPSNGKGSYKGMPREFINEQNKVRKANGAEPLKWDKDLALYARRWANANRKNCKPLHSGSKYAENIYLGRNGWNATAQEAVYGWASEEPLYDKDTGDCLDRHFNTCGHFAIMVNKNYRWVGCGRAECFDGKGVFISCNYNPTPPNATVPLAAPPKLD